MPIQNDIKIENEFNEKIKIEEPLMPATNMAIEGAESLSIAESEA